jgi:uncharacterized membrane protein YdjX (TVP38/TMEM64 family)
VSHTDKCRLFFDVSFLFFLVYMLATVLFFPGSILTLGAGFVFSMAFGLGGGVVLGTISVFLGASCGATIAFLLGRYLLQEQTSRLSKKYAFFEALNLALESNGLKIFILLRYVHTTFLIYLHSVKCSDLPQPWMDII